MFGRRRARRSTGAAEVVHETSWGEQHAADAFAYEMLLMRQLEQDSMLWQTPSLALTAQAFLLTIAFSPSTEPGPRILVAALGIVISLMAIQLMAKHNYLSRLDQAQLRHLEEPGRLNLPPITSRRWAEGPEAVHRSRLVKMSSYRVWQGGLCLIAGVNATVLVLAIHWEYLLTGK